MEISSRKHKKHELIPNSYIIGVQKAGTTSLHYWLSQHPDIYGPPNMKDVDVFADPSRSDNPAEFFKNALSAYKTEKIILHSQVNYILYEAALRRIQNVSADAKLILILRNPIDRAYSAYSYFKKLNREIRSVEQALIYKPRLEKGYSRDYSDFSYIEHGYYYTQISKALDIFNAEQLLILDFDDLKENALDVLKEVYDFLEIPYFEPFMKAKNITGKVKYNWLQRVMTHTSSSQQRFMRTLVNPWFPIEKRQALKKQIREFNTIKKSDGSGGVPKKVIQFLQDCYREEIIALDGLLGKNYTKKWLSNPA